MQGVYYFIKKVEPLNFVRTEYTPDCNCKVMRKT